MALTRVGGEWANKNVDGLNDIVLSNGNILSLWVEDGSGSSKQLLGQIYTPAGVALGARFLLKAVPDGYLNEVHATALADGRFAIAWVHDASTSGNARLEAGIFGSDGVALRAPIQFGSASVTLPRLATLADGGYVMTYFENDITKSVTFDANGNSGSVNTIAPGVSIASAGLRGGGYVSVTDTWTSGTGTQIKAYVRLPDGRATETVIKTWSTFETPQPKVISLANGSFAVAWVEQDTTEPDFIKAQIIDSNGGRVGGELTLYQSAQADLHSVMLEATLDGGFALAFTQSDTQSDVYLGTYSATGVTVTAPMLVNQNTSGNQTATLLEQLKDGTLLVGWKDYNDYSYHHQAFSTGYVVPSGTDPFSTLGLTLNGTKGKDKLTGGFGNDKFYGGYGNDKLTGGTGADVFVFNAKLGTAKTDKKVNFDTITDFKPGEDKIWLDNAIFKKLGKVGTEAMPALLNKKYFKVGEKAGDKNDYLIYNKKSGVLSYDADGNGAKEAIEIAKLSAKLKLSHLDFGII